MKADTVKNKKKISLQTAKEIAGQSGLWMAAATILFLIVVFVKPYHSVIDAIPSPDYESVRLFWDPVSGCSCRYPVGIREETRLAVSGYHNLPGILLHDDSAAVFSSG